MGTSFVGIGDHGFWMQDGILELWLRLLALHIADSPDEATLKTIREIRKQKPIPLEQLEK